ncbi:MAG: hypothetical protein GX763_09600 [Clostridiaceae bacterium]|nr:hypothetical protein [Clostridiaceae bacterium]
MAKQETKKIEDMQTLPEFFGVETGEVIWVEGYRYRIHEGWLYSRDRSSVDDGRVLVGCLTGQLKWSTEPPKSEMTADEKKILREIAAWFPWWGAVHLGRKRGIVYSNVNGNWGVPFDVADKGSKAYEVLAPILEKHGEIGLDDYRGDEDEESPFGSCDFCGYAFNSELISEYEITHCPKCGEEIEESIDLGW